MLVTSRASWPAWPPPKAPRLLALDCSPSEALQLLAARLGTERVAAEPDAVAEIAGLCARLPLALAIAAARAAARPGFPLAALAAELRDAAAGSTPWTPGTRPPASGPSSPGPTSSSAPRPARMFRLLGLHPGPDISVPAAASLAG